MADSSSRLLVGCEQVSDDGNVRQTSGVEFGTKMLGKLSFAGALMGHGEQLDHGPAGVTLGLYLQEGVKRFGVGLSREDLIAIDQVHQSHRLFAEWLD